MNEGWIDWDDGVNNCGRWLVMRAWCEQSLEHQANSFACEDVEMADALLQTQAVFWASL